jgi:predicted esterase
VRRWLILAFALGLPALQLVAEPAATPAAVTPSAATSAAAAEPAAPSPSVTAPAPAAANYDFCSAQTEKLANGVCFFAPEKAVSPSGKRTLVIFLHGLIEEGQGWEHTMQQGMILYAKKHGFSLLFPRGRNGVGPDRKPSVIAWPLGPDVREAHEEAVLAEWAEARKLVEAKSGAFDEVFVMGFSNGAYFSASLALRNKLEVDGYALFAGGSKSALGNLKKPPANARPIFVGVASKDGTTRDKAKELVKALVKVKWPHKAEARKVGHVVGDAHIDAALAYLRAKKSGVAAPPAPTKKAPPSAAPTKGRTSSKRRAK